jgi:DNA-binding CsgD family transcriptional regulator
VVADSIKPNQSREVGQPVFTDETWRRIGSAFALSPRELEIVRRIFDDQKERAMAKALGISPHTVHTYLARVYEKLQVTSRVQVIVQIVRHETRGSHPAPPRGRR